jgi:NDP-sugar pyrophosphorylase family protein
MKALILAAGKGTRLKDLTANMPKPMLRVGEKPLLAHIVNWLKYYGICQLAINLHHAPDAITNYFGDGSDHGVEITYSYEEELLGTAGAAKRLQWFLDEPFVVVYGDVFSNINLARLIDFHKQKCQQFETDSAITLSLYRVPNPTECGLVDLAETGQILRFVEKPPADQVFTDLANAGIQVCEPAILELIPQNSVFDFGHHVYPKMLAARLPIFGLPIQQPEEFLIDIGTPISFERAQQVTASFAQTELSRL